MGLMFSSLLQMLKFVPEKCDVDLLEEHKHELDRMARQTVSSMKWAGRTFNHHGDSLKGLFI